ncbi:MAG: pilus assembly protein [Eubacteriales bacterium]|nr:pilus assembly protein [Eubacteriales bacterium]
MEAALLMSMIVPLLTAIIYMGFFLHDRGFLQAAAHEAVCLASLHAEDDTDINGEIDRLISGRMLGSRGVKGEMEEGKRQVSVSYTGSFRIPGIVQSFFGNTGISVGTSVSLSTERPSRRISRIRGVVKVVEHIRD